MDYKYCLSISGTPEYKSIYFPDFQEALKYFEERWNFRLKSGWTISLYQHEDDYLYARLNRKDSTITYRIERVW